MPTGSDIKVNSESLLLGRFLRGGFPMFNDPVVKFFVALEVVCVLGMVMIYGIVSASL